MITLDINLVNPSLTPEPKNRCVVRIRTSQWSDDRGLHHKRSLTYLRKPSRGFSIVEEDVSCVGAEEVIPKIQNLHSVDDGIYELITTDEIVDRETGACEDWLYCLVPFAEEEVEIKVGQIWNPEGSTPGLDYREIYEITGDVIKYRTERGWSAVRDCVLYCECSERTFRDWIKRRNAKPE